MKKSQPPDERLDASVERAKSVSRELHELLQEGRDLIREIKTLISDERNRTESFMDEAVREQIAELATATQKAISDAVAKVGAEFDKLAAIYINGDSTQHEDSLRAMFTKRAKLDQLIGKPVMIASEAYIKGQVVTNWQGFDFTMGEDCQPLDVLYPHRATGLLHPGPPL